MLTKTHTDAIAEHVNALHDRLKIETLSPELIAAFKALEAHGVAHRHDRSGDVRTAGDFDAMGTILADRVDATVVELAGQGPHDGDKVIALTIAGRINKDPDHARADVTFLMANDGLIALMVQGIRAAYRLSPLAGEKLLVAVRGGLSRGPGG